MAPDLSKRTHIKVLPRFPQRKPASDSAVLQASVAVSASTSRAFLNSSVIVLLMLFHVEASNFRRQCAGELKGPDRVCDPALAALPQKRKPRLSSLFKR